MCLPLRSNIYSILKDYSDVDDEGADGYRVGGYHPVRKNTNTDRRTPSNARTPANPTVPPLPPREGNPS